MSFKRTEKEILTDDFIKQDLLYQFNYIAPLIAISIILCIVSISVFIPFIFISPYAWVVLLIPVFFFVISYIVRNLKMTRVKNGEYAVITGKLLYEKRNELRTELTFYKPKWISYLQFEGYGRWELWGMYYTWSNLYKMSGEGICNTSFVGDTFHLVINKKNNKIVMGYNTKFFDYQNP